MILPVLFFLSSLFPVHYLVEFGDVSEVRAGMPVVYRGVEIGRVDGVTLGPWGKPVADIEVPRKHRGLFREGCAVRLHKEPPRLELIQVDEAKAELPARARIPGLIGALDYLKYGFDRVQRSVRDLKLKEEMGDLQEEMERAWRKGREEFREQWPGLKKKLADLKERLTGDARAQEQIDGVMSEGEDKAR